MVGKRLEIGNFPNGTEPVSYGQDAVNAQIQESGSTEEAAWGNYTKYSLLKV